MFFLAANGIAQKPTNKIYGSENPMQAAFRTVFEVKNVGNLHVYINPTSTEGEDGFFKGELINRGVYGLFDSEWRDLLPEDFQAYAVYDLKDNNQPLYLMRIDGKEVPEEISLFTMDDGALKRIAVLAKTWCEDNRCYQRESWIQDFNGDTELDILIKVKWYTKASDTWTETHAINTVYLQDNAGNFNIEEQSKVDHSDYIMSRPEDLSFQKK